jgi:RNA polymerase sigma factor (sigma-70 family)
MATSPGKTIVQHLRRALLVRNGEGMSDGELLERFIAGRDEAAFAALVRRHGPMVLGVCQRIAANTHDAEDAFQATFLVLVRKADTVRPREMVGNWLYGVAYRTALEGRGKSARRKAREKQVTNMPEPEVRPEELWQELRPVLDQELSRLPDKYRVPLVLCELEGRPRKEAARQLNVPEGTLSSRLATARKMLAGRLRRRGLAVAAGPLAVALSQNGAVACVPVPLVASTVEAAALLAAGETAAGVVSAHVATLTESVVKALLLTKLKATAVALLVISGVALGGGALVQGSLADTEADRPVMAVEQLGTPPLEGSPEAEEEAQPPRGQPKGEASLGGTLQGVDTAKNTVTVTISNRQTGKADKTLALAKDIVVLRDGKPAKLSDLKPGGRITVRLSPDEKTAVSISETGRTMAGPLKSVDPVNNAITLTVSGGRDPVKKDVTFELAKDGRVTLGGKEARLADLKDLKPGSTVQLAFSVDDEKKLVHIQYSARNR